LIFGHLKKKIIIQDIINNNAIYIITIDHFQFEMPQKKNKKIDIIDIDIIYRTPRLNDQNAIFFIFINIKKIFKFPKLISFKNQSSSHICSLTPMFDHLKIQYDECNKE
jgi:hypothetical protein